MKCQVCSILVNVNRQNMPKKNHIPQIFNSLSELNMILGIPQPLHPLVTLSNFYETTNDLSDLAAGVMLNFYQISFKKYYTGTIGYGQTKYDFSKGGLSFIAPNQLLASGDDDEQCEGLTLLFHPDFLKGHSLAKNIKNYGFFSYNSNESLQLSLKEKEVIQSIFNNIQGELEQGSDDFSQTVIISYIELLLNYSDRFYNRQFIARKNINSDLLSKMECLLADYFQNEVTLRRGLPTVQYLSDELALSSGYLSDMLRNLTGLNAQQHIHLKVIANAKELLALGQLTIAEISYQLGFEHPQSFSKLFKKKTGLSPYEYRQHLNHPT